MLSIYLVAHSDFFSLNPFSCFLWHTQVLDLCHLLSELYFSQEEAPNTELQQKPVQTCAPYHHISRYLFQLYGVGFEMGGGVKVDESTHYYMCKIRIFCFPDDHHCISYRISSECIILSLRIFKSLCNFSPWAFVCCVW